MSWSQNAKQALFGNDRDFLDRYCTAMTRARLDRVETALARAVLCRLADVIPRAVHATPDLWTPSKEPQPIVAIGRLNAGGNILEPKVGLCGNDRLYLFARRDNMEAFSKHAKLPRFPDLWIYWRSAGNCHDYVRSNAHLDCSPSGDLPENDSLRDGGPLWRFLEWIRDQQIAENWIVSPQAAKRLSAERRPIEGGFNGFNCIYPQLVKGVFP